MKKLNFGCGKDYRVGWINLDINKNVKADIYADAEKKLDLDDNSFDLIILRHVIEHIHPEKFNFLLKELHRISKPNGRIKIWSPHFSCGITYREISHYTPISYFTIQDSELFQVIEKRFHFFRRSFPYNNRFAQIITRILNPLLSFFPNLSPLFYERFFCWLFPVEEIYFDLKVNKKLNNGNYYGKGI
ncbi:MAG: methyltransferase domain-containing protein [Candidatus Pacearchaeota archaeon]